MPQTTSHKGSAPATTTPQTTSGGGGRVPHIHKLVDLVLMNIFLMVVRDKSRFKRHKLHLGYPKLNTAPLILSQVCGEWRHIAHATPHLWTEMRVLNADAGVVQLIRHVYLRKSKNCLLDVKLKQTAVPGFSSPARMKAQILAINQILKLWIGNAGRLRSVNVVTHSGDCLHQVPMIAPGSTPHLESVKLWCTDVQTRGNSSDLATIHQNHFEQRQAENPQLRQSDVMQEAWNTFTQGTSGPYMQTIWDNILASKTVKRARWGPNYPPNVEDMKQLVRINIFNPNISQLLEALSYCPKLERLQVFSLKIPEHQRLGAITTLPHLHTLSVTIGPDDVSPLFERLTLPRLKTLKIAPIRNVDLLLKMIQRSKCTLERLDLAAHKDLSSEDLDRFLEHSYLSSLKRLLLSQFEMKSSTFLTLKRRVYGSREIYPLPNLQDLTLNYIRGSDGLLADMVESRFKKDLTGLRHLFVYVCDPSGERGIASIDPEDMDQRTRLKNPKDFARLLELYKQGLDLVWYSVHGRVTVWKGEIHAHRAQSGGGTSMLNPKDTYENTMKQGVCCQELNLKED
ncbi:hypothetical protein BDN72DRAFT_412135 [Pluteus cervinus]|uniref:Uncharacterized protein n=1 Tax=Pluteus cervinus TaxID=181527 RepID=A0ACD3A8V8_9AGAR|nr:hypothetical protein BDN72DRAFT_412135 [Pluteus cervinus]